MKNLGRNIILWTLILNVLPISNSYGQDNGQLLDQCDKTLNSAKSVITLQVDYINKLEANKSELEGALERSLQKNIDLANPPWYSKPENTLLIGFIGGMVSALYIHSTSTNGH